MTKFLLLFLCGLSMSCTHSRKPEEAIRSVKCDLVKGVENLADRSSFSGRVKPALEANVSFRVAGQIARVQVVQGQFVRKGAVLAQLDDRDYRTQLSATEAEYKRIKSEADRVIELYQKQSATPNDYDKAVYGLQQISAKLEAHRNALSDTRLLAPYDGTIEKVFFNIGETVNAGMAVASIISLQQPEIEINIPSVELVRQGHFTSATATIHAFEGKVFELKLIGINPKANLNQLYTARFAVLGSPSPSPGMTAMVNLNYENEGSDWMQIPLTALQGDKVWIVVNGKVSQKSVQVIAIKSNGRAWVQGLKEGDLVVSAGTTSLKEGMPVKILAATAKTNEGGLL